MYKILLKLKYKISHEDWVKMAEQAKEKGKLTNDEYNELMSIEE